MGQFHLQNLLNIHSIEHIYAFDVFPETFKISSEKISYSTKLEDFDTEDFDFVDIVAPTKFHFSYLEKYIRMWKNIFVEKPIVSNNTEFKKLENLIEDCNYQGKIVIWFIERFNVVSQFLKNELSKRWFPKQIEIFRYNPASDRIQDVGVTEDLMVHDLDLIHYFFEDTPFSLMGKNTLSETSTVLLENNGTQILLSANSITQQKIREIKFYYPELTIIGNLTLAKIDFFHKPSTYLSEKWQDLSISYMLEEKILVKNNQLKEELEAFILLLKWAKNMSLCNFSDTKKTMELLGAILV